MFYNTSCAACGTRASADLLQLRLFLPGLLRPVREVLLVRVCEELVPEVFLVGQRHHGDYRPDLRDGAWVLVLEKSPICQYLDMLIFTAVCLRMGMVGSRTWTWVIPLVDAIPRIFTSLLKNFAKS